MANATHSGYDTITNQKLDTLYRLYTKADNMAAELNYDNEHFNECAKAAHDNYYRSVAEANEVKFPSRVKLLQRRFGGSTRTIPYTMWVSTNDLQNGDIYEFKGDTVKVTRNGHKNISLSAHNLAYAPENFDRNRIITKY